MRWGRWNDPPARATRGLRRMGRERPGALFARRTRTMKRCSFDAALLGTRRVPIVFPQSARYKYRMRVGDGARGNQCMTQFDKV